MIKNPYCHCEHVDMLRLMLKAHANGARSDGVPHMDTLTLRICKI